MFNLLAIKIFCVGVLIYFIVDLTTSLVGRYLEYRVTKEFKDSIRYHDQSYFLEANNYNPRDAEKEELPEIPDNMAKKVLKAKKKMP